MVSEQNPLSTNKQTNHPSETMSGLSNLHTGLVQPHAAHGHCQLSKISCDLLEQSAMLRLCQLRQQSYQLLVHDLGTRCSSTSNVLCRLPSLVVRMSNYSGNSNLLRVS